VGLCRSPSDACNVIKIGLTAHESPNKSCHSDVFETESDQVRSEDGVWTVHDVNVLSGRSTGSSHEDVARLNLVTRFLVVSNGTIRHSRPVHLAALNISDPK